MGGGKKSKAPATPDYSGIAQTEAAENRKTAQELTRWNRPTQIDQFGNTLGWEQDEAGNWTQGMKLSDQTQQQQQMLRDEYQNSLSGLVNQGGFNPMSMYYANENFNQAAYGNGDFANTAGDIGNFDRTQGDRVAADVYESVMGRARPEQQREQAALDVQLRQQGLQPGTEAYNRSMQNLMTSHGDVATQAGLDSTLAGYGAARDIYNTNLGGQGQRFQQAQSVYDTNTAQDWKTAQHGLQFQQQAYNQGLQNYTLPMERAQATQQLFANAPGGDWQGFSGATGYNPADMMGAAQAGYQAKMGASNASQNKKGGLMGTAGTLGAGYLSGKSDETLKVNITPLSGIDAVRTILMLGGYEYDWEEDGMHDMGVIAQQVQKAIPSLVEKAYSGKLEVNYTGIVALLVEAFKYLEAQYHGRV